VAHDDYQGGDLMAKIRQTNDEVLILVQVETSEGVKNVEEIAAVDGIDGLWIGQFDLTTSMGMPGQFDHPDFLGATRRVVEACRRQGKAAVLSAMDLATLCRGPAEGYRMLVYLGDLWIYQQALRQGLGVIRESLAHPGARTP
jgi:2-dehydro-3-deoxyglucarate aldolase/4-hydroxy-2-oxoheptanedioate aldolase